MKGKYAYFRKGDLLVYALLLLLVSCLICRLVLNYKKPTTGIAVEVGGERVYTYRYGAGGRIENGVLAEEREENGLLIVTVYASEERSAFNEVVFDCQDKSAYVREANCSFSKECTRMRKISGGRGVIVCVPHALVVRSLEEKTEFSPSVG